MIICKSCLQTELKTYSAMDSTNLSYKQKKNGDNY